MRITRERRTSGFTLIEVVISATLLSMLLLSVAATTRSAGEARNAGLGRELMDVQAHQTLEFILAELASARRDGLTPEPLADLASSALVYQPLVGFADGAQLWGAPRSIVFELDPEELDDGIDNDGDGIVDEGRIVWRENPGTADERTVVKCHGVRGYLAGEVPDGDQDENLNGLVDERGLAFEIDGDVLTVRLTLERTSSEGGTILRTVESSVRVRN